MGKKNKYYVTTPIYYVNDKPHIGHAYTTILADVLAEYHRILDIPTFFLTGTDEHGQKVQEAAEKKGITPQKQADKTVVRFQDLWKRLEVTHDDFIRTTEKRHTGIVQEVLQDLYDRDEIYKAEYEGWYCVGCERFFTEKDIEEGVCPECARGVNPIKESNYFFRMGKYKDWLIQHIKDNPEFIQPDFRRNETLGFLERDLEDLCISRPKSRLSWGIELPFDQDFVTYVWFDALLNYITAVGYGSDEAEFEKWWPASCHLIGKDILTTHTVYWPTMLKAMGLPLPKTIFAHGWWLTGRSKMSKSLGNVVNPMEMIDKYGVDPFRYFLIAGMTLGQDASFTEKAFVRRFNSDLANDLGNLLSRVLNMISRYCDGKLPPFAEDFAGSAEADVWGSVQRARDEMEKALEKMSLSKGIDEVMATVRELNRYLEQKAPWTQAKENETEALGTTLYTAAESLRVVATLLYPVMPAKMELLRRSLGVSDQKSFRNMHKWGLLEPGTRIEKIKPLFPRIEKTKKNKNSSKKQKKPNPSKNLISIEDVDKLKLRTARIVAAERVPKTDKLMRLEIDLGGERRQIVAGIAQEYSPENLPGKLVVVVANLKPAKLRGVRSEGMLLAARGEDGLQLLTVDGEIKGGAQIS